MSIIEQTPPEIRKYVHWIVAVLIAGVWAIVASALDVIASGSVEVHYTAPLVRYLSAIGIIGISVLVWRGSLFLESGKYVHPKDGIFYTLILFVVSHATFTAVGFVHLPGYDHPRSLYYTYTLLLTPFIYFTAHLVREDH